MLNNIKESLSKFKDSLKKMTPVELIEAETALEQITSMIEDDIFQELFKLSVKDDPEWCEAINSDQSAKKLTA